MGAAAQVSPLAWTPERVAAFQPSVDASPWGPLATPPEVMQGAYLWDYQRGAEHALLAVRPLARQCGTRLDIVGIVSDGDGALSPAALDAAVMDIARRHGAQLLSMSTQRPALVAACARRGWVITGAVMLKTVSLQ